MLNSSHVKLTLKFLSTLKYKFQKSEYLAVA
jgi:hypothetical protein